MRNANSKRDMYNHAIWSAKFIVGVFGSEYEKHLLDWDIFMLLARGLHFGRARISNFKRLVAFIVASLSVEFPVPTSNFFELWPWASPEY